jgi:hypothetical protein
VKIKGISPVADHWRTKAEELERQLARQSALLRDAVVYLNDFALTRYWSDGLVDTDTRTLECPL